MDSCDKIRYDSLVEACAALRAIRRRSVARGRKSPTGAYFCCTCRCWHLTSKSSTRVPTWMRKPAANGGGPASELT